MAHTSSFSTMRRISMKGGRDFLRFRGAGFLNVLDSKRIQHFLEECFLFLRQIALRLGFQNGEDVDNLLGMAKTLRNTGTFLTGAFSEQHECRRSQGVDKG